MPIPHLPEIMSALWEELNRAGGSGKAQDVIKALAERFQITPAEREQRDQSGSKTFDHRVHSAIAQSRIYGYIKPVKKAGRGFWKLTEVYYDDNPPKQVIMPHCHECKEKISIPAFKKIGITGSLVVPIVLAYCPTCGCILGVASQESCQAE